MESCEEDIFCGINKTSTEEPKEMDALEKKHTPVITAPVEVIREKN